MERPPTSRGGLWYKPAIAVAGGVVVLAGVVMLVTPGPGWLTIAAGVAIWATEYDWARRLLERVRAKLRRVKRPGGGEPR